MRTECQHAISRLSRALCVVTAAAVLSLGATTAASAQSPALTELLAGVVHLKTVINPDGRTVKNLGREREGSAVVIDGQGLILTIGYLMTEAYSAEVRTNDGQDVPADVLGYDQETGFGVLKAAMPLKVHPIAFGKS